MDDDELLAGLGDALRDPVPPPPRARLAELRATVEAARDAPAAPAALAPARRGRSTRWVLAAVAAVVVVVVGVAVVALARSDSPVGTVEYAGPIVGDGAEGQLDVTMTGIGRVVELRTDQLPILPKGEYYEIWFVGPGDGPGTPNRISAGTFHPDPDGRSDVTFAAAVDPALYPVVEVTAEPGDGDPSPTGDVVMRAVIPS